MLNTCLICLEYIDDEPWVCATCKVHIHIACKTNWEDLGNNSCPHCRQLVIGEPPMDHLVDSDPRIELRRCPPATHRCSYYFTSCVICLVFAGAMLFLLYEFVHIEGPIPNITYAVLN